MGRLDRPQRAAVFSSTLLAAAVVTLLVPAIAAVAIFAVLAILSLILRVVAVERGVQMSLLGRVVLVAAAAVLGTRLVLWFGPIGALIALMAIVMVLVIAGADIG